MTVTSLLTRPQPRGTSPRWIERSAWIACVLIFFAFGSHHVRNSDVHATALSRPQIVTSSDPSRKAESATSYMRQREEADRLLNEMRGAPDGWVRNSFHRPTHALWVDPFRDFYRCPATVEKVGKMSDGGKWLCGVDTYLQRPGCVIYSLGSNGDTSFEEAVINRTTCSVWTFDPTLNEVATAKVKAVPGLNFAAVGVSHEDGELQLRGKARPVRTLANLMKERGHTWIDVLKMDVEGAEWPVLKSFIQTGTRLPVTQAQIEFHVRDPQDAIETMDGLLGLGMRVFHVEENNYCAHCPGHLYELALAHTSAQGELLLDRTY